MVTDIIVTRKFIFIVTKAT